MTITDTDAGDRADMERLQTGDDAGLDALLERHAAAIFRFAFRMLGNEDDANDVAQETFVRLYRARASYHPGRRFSTWLYTIAANLARNQLRWRARHPAVALDAPVSATDASLADALPAAAPAPDAAVQAGERAAAVRAAVQRLPDDLREAIVLCEWEELPVAEAAALLRTTPKAVESRLYRARQLLRARLRKWL
jgi:RNA polymerase sigma-70 factor (ECF subfamily)